MGEHQIEARVKSLVRVIWWLPLGCQMTPDEPFFPVSIPMSARVEVDKKRNINIQLTYKKSFNLVQHLTRSLLHYPQWSINLYLNLLTIIPYISDSINSSLTSSYLHTFHITYYLLLYRYFVPCRKARQWIPKAAYQYCPVAIRPVTVGCVVGVKVEWSLVHDLTCLYLKKCKDVTKISFRFGWLQPSCGSVWFFH